MEGLELWTNFIPPAPVVDRIFFEGYGQSKNNLTVRTVRYIRKVIIVSTKFIQCVNPPPPFPLKGGLGRGLNGITIK
jgi:hypothetical protein